MKKAVAVKILQALTIGVSCYIGKKIIDKTDNKLPVKLKKNKKNIAKLVSASSVRYEGIHITTSPVSAISQSRLTTCIEKYKKAVDGNQAIKKTTR